jgi:lipopolysaccharide export system protein LptC
MGSVMTAGADGLERVAIGPRHEDVRAAPPPDREAQFAAAGRRSVRVRFLRKMILAGVIGTAAAMVGIAIFDPFGVKFGSLSFSAVTMDGAKIAMVKPKLAGFRSDGQPYILNAERALQDVKHPTLAELQGLSGEMGSTDGETTRLSADSGIYDTAAEHMKLTGNVKIGSPRFQVLLRSADIDFKGGVYRSEEPVEVHVGETATIFSDRATARNNGQELTFEGRVRTRINSQDSDSAGKGTNP